MSPDYELFNRNWSIYQKVVRADYMRHQIIGQEITSVFKSLGGVPAEIIDLGCGDAQEIARQARSFPVRSFTGYDLSAMALQIADKNLDYMPERSLRCEPMESVVHLGNLTSNFVFSGYAIHHLQDNMKKKMLQEVHRILRPNSHFLLADVFMKPDQSRPDYLDRYIGMVRSDWTILTGGDIQAVVEHLKSSDFPAASDQFISWATEAGLSLINSDTHNEQHHVYHFLKPS